MRRVVLVLVVAACGDNLLPAQPVALAEFADTARDAICDWSVRCQHVPDRDTCERLLDPKDYDTRRVSDSIAFDRLAYDPLAAGVCFEATRDAHCLVLPFTDRACGRMFAGQVGLGEECTANFECRDDRTCDPVLCDGQCCYGTCLTQQTPEPTPTLARIGETCATHFDCVPEAYCENGGVCTATPEREGQRCLFGCARGDLFCDLGTLTCQKLAGAGQACDPAGVSAPPCDAAWAFCDQTCQPRPGPGEACDDQDKRCIPASSCVDGVCIARAAAGELCEDDDDCEVACVENTCVAYETCRGRSQLLNRDQL